MLQQVAQKHSSKSTKYELEGSHGDPLHENFYFVELAKLPRECNEILFKKSRICFQPPPRVYAHVAHLLGKSGVISRTVSDVTDAMTRWFGEGLNFVFVDGPHGFPMHFLLKTWNKNIDITWFTAICAS